jgi:hypothetical protein
MHMVQGKDLKQGFRYFVFIRKIRCRGCTWCRGRTSNRVFYYFFHNEDEDVQGAHGVGEGPHAGFPLFFIS